MYHSCYGMKIAFATRLGVRENLFDFPSGSIHKNLYIVFFFISIYGENGALVDFTVYSDALYSLLDTCGVFYFDYIICVSKFTFDLIGAKPGRDAWIDLQTVKLRLDS